MTRTSYFGFIASKTLNYLAFQTFDFEHTWWRLFQKRVVRTKFEIYSVWPKVSHQNGRRQTY